ncbi:MAG: carbamoyltransferase HypF, partial [Bacteroidota bacterium]
MNTWYIHIQGQVQGVGFRPFIYSLAKAHGLNGWVNNDVDGVHIAFNGDEETARSFKKNIVKKAPQLARITSIELDHRKQTFFDNFQIIRSERSGKSNVLITPDVAICKDCSKELWQNDNRRKSYPFITCTNCGPRYSIFQQLPYDRATTTMDDFQMCNVCKAEYENPLDRRYYSQTNSCPNCNIELTLLDSNLVEITNDVSAVLNLVIEYWEAGKIVALKGIGGYLLTCDANNEAAISRLRKRKHRPSKPFALMYPNVASLTQFELFPEAIDALNYPTASIVLLDLKEEAVTVHSIAPQLKQIGLMLPYTPLYELLLRQFGKAIVATSGNISNTPIIFEDEKAKKELSSIADFILTNNRKIVVPQDDSVIKFSPFTKQKIILRRSRGLAPSYINAHLKVANTNILAMGAMLKSTFSLQHQNNIYISQYLGDLQQFDTQQSYQHT